MPHDHAFRFFHGGNPDGERMNVFSLRTVCAAAVFFGLILTLLPDGRERRMASLCATCALIILLLGHLRSIRWEEYAISLAQTREAAERISSDANIDRERMNRYVIERECEEYIMDKAEDYGLELASVRVTAAWHREGVWVPDTARLVIKKQNEAQRRLVSWMEAQLGINEAHQEWSIEDSS